MGRKKRIVWVLMLGLLAAGLRAGAAAGSENPDRKGDAGDDPAAAAAPPEETARQPRADVVVEYGIDSRERRFYRPRFRFNFPVGNSDLSAEIHYDEYLNGRLQGIIDYWVMVGLSRALTPGLKLEARLNHFCRHHTGLDTAYVLNLNELLARAWLQGRGFRMGLGGGVYTGGSDDFRRLLTLNLEAPRLLLPELSLAAEVKWVDFDRLVYDLDASLDLGRGVSLFLRHGRPYRLPAMTYLGLRLAAAAGFRPLADRVLLSTGVYVNDELYKIYVMGEYRVSLLERSDRRFFLNASFVTPVLNGERFFAQFWPDKMVYDVAFEYERRLRRAWLVSWYGRYQVDMPVDKALPFRSSLATGLALRNRPDFERLDRAFRFEGRAGVDFRHRFDFGLKLGLNTMPRRHPALGFNLGGWWNNQRLALEGVLFAAWTRPVQLRPFLRWSSVSYRDHQWPVDHRLAVGITMGKWF